MAENTAALRALARLRCESELMFSLRREGLINVDGEGPQPYRTYIVKVFAETYVKPENGDGEPQLSTGPHIFRIEAKANYPLKDAPVVQFLTASPAHINVFAKGQVCIGQWSPKETMASETVRTLRVLFLDPATYNFNSVADSNMRSFCGRHAGGIPDSFPLPCPVFLDEKKVLI